MTDTPEAQMVTDIESLNSASLMIEDKYVVEFEHLDKLVVDMDNKEVDSQLENILACEKNGSCKNHEDFQNDSHRCIENADTEFSSMVLIEKKTEKLDVFDTAGGWMQDKDLLENYSDEDGASTAQNAEDKRKLCASESNGGDKCRCLNVIAISAESSSYEVYPESSTHGNAFIKKHEKTINEHDNVDVTYQEEEAVKADSSITEFNKTIVKSQEAVKAERSKTDCVIDNVTIQEEAVKVGKIKIIDSGISSYVDGGCPEVTTKTPDHHDGHSKKKQKKNFIKRFFSFGTNKYSFENEEYKENRKHAMEKFEYFWLKMFLVRGINQNLKRQETSFVMQNNI
ncbi:hypothetical protein DPMN_082750 [Dreissena polymorpha]|uniref:Uncharacterized protein n=1 Tax=Dreissena polymorpha TaxID=45954 RepID=A0A9D3Y7G7_DREPO|nr:hypothetical protein DPMN_082750 [Dreissena polymorpha]